LNVTQIDVAGYEAVYRFEGEPSGFVALHRTVGGKAFGGLRIRAYPTSEAALADALLLGRAMTLKLASVEIPGGGGKAVLEATSLGADRAAAIGRFADWVESLDGRYVTGPDLGVGADDVAQIERRTASTVAGDLSASTAMGVRQAMRGALTVLRGTPDLSGRVIAIQGLGSIGARLARTLTHDGAQVIVADLDPSRARALVEELGVAVVGADEILTTECDVLCPCAVGGVIDVGNRAAVRAALVCGGANNIVADDATVEALHARGVSFVPDFLSSAGGAVQGASTHLRGPGDYSTEVLDIERRVRELLAQAAAREMAPQRLALERIERTVGQHE
jgi:leucine dehydrogenase